MKKDVSDWCQSYIDYCHGHYVTTYRLHVLGASDVRCGDSTGVAIEWRRRVTHNCSHQSVCQSVYQSVY
jgi:hypothetical protein